MINKLLYTVLVLLFFQTIAFAQQKVTWKQLAAIKWVKGYVPSLKGTYDLPKFSAQIDSLDGKTVQIKGFYIPLQVDGKTFALSANPSSMCFFCNNAGPESVIEVAVPKENPAFDKMRTDKFIEIKGKLILNVKDPDHLMYIMKDAKLLKVIN